ncbi:MAG TPA: hypothetical protein V6C96_01065 [Vampirovibrionales bacterium]
MKSVQTIGSLIILLVFTSCSRLPNTEPNISPELYKQTLKLLPESNMPISKVNLEGFWYLEAFNGSELIGEGLLVFNKKAPSGRLIGEIAPYVLEPNTLKDGFVKKEASVIFEDKDAFPNKFSVSALPKNSHYEFVVEDQEKAITLHTFVPISNDVLEGAALQEIDHDLVEEYQVGEQELKTFKSQEETKRQMLYKWKATRVKSK